MDKRYSTIMIKKELKGDMDKICFDMGKMSYSEIINFLLNFYNKNK